MRRDIKISKQRLKSLDPEVHWENFTLLEFPSVNVLLKTRYPGETVNDPRLYITRSGKILQYSLKRTGKKKRTFTRQQVGAIGIVGIWKSSCQNIIRLSKFSLRALCIFICEILIHFNVPFFPCMPVCVCTYKRDERKVWIIHRGWGGVKGCGINWEYKAKQG